MNTVVYGQKKKLIGQFYSDKSIIQQFTPKLNNYLQSIQPYIHIYENKNRDYSLKFIIIDKNQNLLFATELYCGDVFQSGFYKIKTNLYLDVNQQYYLCIDSYQKGDNHNYVGFYIGYRKKLMNFFINNNFSLGQLYCKFNFQERKN